MTYLNNNHDTSWLFLRFQGEKIQFSLRLPYSPQVLCVCVCVCVCVCIHIYIYIYSSLLALTKFWVITTLVYNDTKDSVHFVTCNCIHIYIYISEEFVMANREKLKLYHSIWYVFVNCKWVVTRWQLYNTNLHINNTQNDTKKNNT
jgi:hypothetical protein